MRKTTKKGGGLTAIKDNDRILPMDYQRIEHVVQEELAKIFSIRKSRIFKSRNEQIIKEMNMKDTLGWQKWTPKIKPETEYEGEVCTAVSMHHVKSIISNLKEDRAPGVDDVSTNMLKLSSQSFLVRLTEVINAILLEGEVPESLLIGQMTLIDIKEPPLC